MIMEEYKRNLFYPSRLNLILLFSLVCGCYCAFNSCSIEEEPLHVSDVFLSTTKISALIVMFLGLQTLYEWVFHIKTTLRSVESVEEDNRTTVVENDEHYYSTTIKDAGRRAAATNTDFGEFNTDEPVKGQIAKTASYVKEPVTSMGPFLRQTAAKNDAFIRKEVFKNSSWLTKQALENDKFIRMQIARRCDYLRKKAGKSLNLIKCLSGY